MRALFCIGLFCVLVTDPVGAAPAIHRGPATRDSTYTQRRVILTPGERVRIGMTDDPDRIPDRLRGQFVGTVVGLNHDHLTVVLSDGTPAVIQRDLVTGIELGVDHGSRAKHALIGTGIGLLFGALVGFAQGDDPSGDLIAFSAEENAVMGMILFAPIGFMTGAVLPYGQSWKDPVSLDRVQLHPTSRGGAR
jgi:hypothetical protein